MKFYKEKVKELMKKKQYSKNRLAALIGSSHTAVSTWLEGKHVPKERNIILLSRVLEVPVNKISNMEVVEDISNDISGYFQGWGSSLDKEKKELDDPCLKAMKEIENIKSEQYRLRTVTRAFMSTMQSMLYVKNYHGEYILANESYLNSIGLDINVKIIGKNDAEILSQKVAKVNHIQDISIMNTGKSLINKTIKFPFYHKRIKWCVMSKVPLRDKNRNIVGIVASFTDISEEIKLRKQDKMLNDAIKQTNAAVGIVSISSGKRKYVWANDPMLNNLGYSNDDLKRNYFCWLDNVIKKEDMTKLLEYIDDSEKKVRSTSFSYLHPITGKKKNYIIKSSKVKDSKLVYHCLYDETEKKRIENEKENLMTACRLLASCIDDTRTACFIGEYKNTKLELVQYIYRNKKSYKYIDDLTDWKDIYDPKQRDELVLMAKNNKYPRKTIYNVIKKDGTTGTIEEKVRVLEENGKKYFFSFVTEIEKQENIEVFYPDIDDF